jgi:hypothetical protein
MRTLIYGSSTIQDYSVILAGITASGFTPTSINTNQASGPSVFGYRWAMSQTPKIPVRVFRPDWGRLGKPAGIICNREMATFSDCAILFWDGTNADWMTPALRQYCRGLHPVCRVHFIQHQPNNLPTDLVQQGRLESNADM